MESVHGDKRYRYSLDIVRNMLLVATMKVRKTRIMYQASACGLAPAYIDLVRVSTRWKKSLLKVYFGLFN